MNLEYIDMEKINSTKIRKHNVLVEAHYDLKEIHQKIILIMCSFIRLEDTKFREIRMKVTDMFKLLGITGTNHSYLDEITDELTTKRLRYKAIIDGVPELVSVPWMSLARYRKGYVHLKFNDAIANYLLNLRGNFTTLSLIVGILLSGKYTKRIYELLSQYKKIGSRSIELDHLRSMLGLEGNKYSRWVDFKRYVLDHAHDQINEIADIKFNYKPVKSGRKVSKIEFEIISNNQNKIKLESKLNNTKETDVNKLIEKVGEFRHPQNQSVNNEAHLASFIMKNCDESELDNLKVKLKLLFSYSNDDIEEIISEYDRNYITEKYQYFLEIKDTSNIKNPSGWFKKALSENYTSNASNSGDLDHDIFYTNSNAEKLSSLTVKIQELRLHASSLRNDIESPVSLKNNSIKQKYEDELKETLEKIAKTKDEIETLTGY